MDGNVIGWLLEHNDIAARNRTLTELLGVGKSTNEALAYL